MANKLAGSLQVHVRLTQAMREEIERQIAKAHMIGSERPRTIQAWMEKAATCFVVINSTKLKQEMQQDVQAAKEFAATNQEFPLFGDQNAEKVGD